MLRHVVGLDAEEHCDLVVTARGVSHLLDVAREPRKGYGGHLPGRRLHGRDVVGDTHLGQPHGDRPLDALGHAPGAVRERGVDVVVAREDAPLRDAVRRRLAHSSTVRPRLRLTTLATTPATIQIVLDDEPSLAVAAVFGLRSM